MATDAELAYLAGFADGEGYFGVVTHNGISRGRFCVGNTYRPVLDRFEKAFGGKTYLRKSRPNRKPFWLWQVQKREEVGRACQLLLPYLQEKHERAQLILDWIEDRTKE